MLESLNKTLLSLKDSTVWKYSFISFLINIFFFAVLYILIAFLIATSGFTEKGLVGIFGVAVALIITWLSFPTILLIIISFFAEPIVKEVNENYYKNVTKIQEIGFFSKLGYDIKFLFFALLLNLLVLPLYIIPGINLVVYYAVNGYLLGRELFMIASRVYLSESDATVLRKKNRTIIYLAGAAIAFLATIPVINLIVFPVALIFMVHLFNEIR